MSPSREKSLRVGTHTHFIDRPTDRALPLAVCNPHLASRLPPHETKRWDHIYPPALSRTRKIKQISAEGAPPLLPSAQPLALRRSATFQQPISFFIVTDRWRKTWLLSTSPNKRLPSIHLLKNFGCTSVNLLARFVVSSSPMVDRGMFNLQLTSINRCFFEIQGISSFFGPPRCRVCCQIMRLNTHGAAASS